MYKCNTIPFRQFLKALSRSGLQAYPPLIGRLCLSGGVASSALGMVYSKVVLFTSGSGLDVNFS
jgi:hypothetical protein